MCPNHNKLNIFFEIQIPFIHSKQAQFVTEWRILNSVKVFSVAQAKSALLIIDHLWAGLVNWTSNTLRIIFMVYVQHLHLPKWVIIVRFHDPELPILQSKKQRRALSIWRKLMLPLLKPFSCISPMPSSAQWQKTSLRQHEFHSSTDQTQSTCSSASHSPLNYINSWRRIRIQVRLCPHPFPRHVHLFPTQRWFHHLSPTRKNTIPSTLAPMPCHPAQHPLQLSQNATQTGSGWTRPQSHFGRTSERTTEFNS